MVSLLTVNYKQPAVTLELIRSLQQLTYPNWELVVVNNGREGEILSAPEFEGMPLKFVTCPENRGFAGGNNYGLKYCKGKYILFLNNDTEVSAGLLEPMVDICEKDAKVGMLSPKIVFYGSQNILQYAGATDLNEFTMRNKSIGYGEEDQGQYDYIGPTGYVHGAAMMVPVAVIEKLGPMYEDFFLYYEEYDWCYRIRKAGYKIMYCGKARIYHKESLSTGVESPLKIYYLMRNRLLFARRNFTAPRKLLSFLFFTAVSLPVNSLRFLLKGRGDLLAAAFRAWKWNLSYRNL